MTMVKVFLMISALALAAVSAGGDESAEAAGRRLVMASATAAAGNGQIKSMDSWLRWLLMRSRPSDKVIQSLIQVLNCEFILLSNLFRRRLRV